MKQNKCKWCKAPLIDEEHEDGVAQWDNKECFSCHQEMHYLIKEAKEENE